VLRQNSMYTNLVPCSISVYADELAPMVMPSTYYSYQVDGWYLKNPLPLTKANWYVPPCGLTVGQLEYLAFGVLPISLTGLPYISIFTAPQSSGNAGSWYHAKHVFESYSTTPTALTPTYAYCNVSGSPTLSTPTIPGYTSIQMTSAGSNNAGTLSSTDKIIAISFEAGNKQDVAANAVELILHEVNLITATGTISNKFSNDSVINMFSAQSVSALYAYLFDSSNNLPPPVTTHSGFTTDPTAIYYAKQNYASSTGQVMATYIPL
jgi:hypothetical protein